MTSLLFKRSYTLTIGSRQIRGLDIGFEVERTLTRDPNTAKIKVWGLAETSRGTINRNDRVTLAAGYSEQETTIFIGEIREFKHTLETTEWVTEIEASDGRRVTRSARVNRSFAAGTPVPDAAGDIMGSMGIDLGDASDIIQRAAARVLPTFPRGVVASGSATDELTRITDTLALEWSIQDGALQILERGRALDREAIVLNASTGMIGSPSIEKNKLKVKTLIIPDLLPGRRIRVEARAIQGTYRAEKVSYKGELPTGDWYCELECKEEVA
jgi:hypothetical protein